MGIARAELLDILKRAYEMEEVMADLLNALAVSRVLSSAIPERDRQKTRKMLAAIHADTLEHQKVVSTMIRNLME